MELKGTHHRGIDDAHNIAAIYRYMQTNRKS
jgi:inhibitor of KinA sporulation pathway (predicted exonuclease)